MRFQLQPVDKIEVVTLQDNFIDGAAFDGTPVVRRASPLKNGEIKTSIGAEHGFSALVTITAGTTDRSILFDFGFSERGALANADALGVPLGGVETLVLSHGHVDHHGGLISFGERLRGKGVELVLHPSAFRSPRYVKASNQTKFALPALSRSAVEQAGIRIVETTSPRPLLGRTLLFLGEIPKKTAFEKGFPHGYYQEGGIEQWDPTEDDSAIVGHVRDMGLVVLTGCGHSGIVNTVNYARAVTGVDQVYVIMGGFHLSGRDFEPIIEPTTQALKAMRPRYVVPAHCTGRKAALEIERQMPEQFLLNMSGTRMVFSR